MLCRDHHRICLVESKHTKWESKMKACNMIPLVLDDFFGHVGRRIEVNSFFVEVNDTGLEKTLVMRKLLYI